MRRYADHPAATWVLAAVALAVAAAGAVPFAGSWNDGSRLAAVESLVDRGTLAIDDSVFTRPQLPGQGPSPYPARPASSPRARTENPCVRGARRAGGRRGLRRRGWP